MADLTLRQLRYFDALARHLHFGRAAGEVAVTQPALSMQIADLEALLGAALVERTRRGVTLTLEGDEFARRGQRILQEIHDLVESVQSRGRLLRGPLRLGVIPSVAPYALPRMLPTLRAQYPELELRLRETMTRSLVTELLDGKLDLLLLAMPIEEAGVETQGLFEDRFLLATSEDYDTSNMLLPVEEIMARETLLLLEEGHCLRDQALRFCNLRRNDKVDTFGVSSISTVVQMVANGYGVTLLPEIAVELEARHSRVKLLRFAPPEPAREIGLAWRARSPRKEDFLEFGRLIRIGLGVGGAGAAQGDA
jgi:LysR family transcriptional regulator, hydrogen peroxide-inducible genes activator